MRTALLRNKLEEIKDSLGWLRYSIRQIDELDDCPVRDRHINDCCLFADRVVKLTRELKECNQ